MVTRTSQIVGVVLTMLLVCVGAVSAQMNSSGDEKLAAMRLDNLRIKEQGIGNLLGRLALSYDIPIGLEIARDENELAQYSFEFDGGTLSDLLTKFVMEHKEYRWEISGGTVNIFPEEAFRDPILGQILQTEISRFSVKENTSSGAFERSLVNTPEVRKILEATGISSADENVNGFFIRQLGRHFSLDVSNMQMRVILNTVIRESPVAKIWVAKRRVSAARFFVRLNSRHEDAPRRPEE